MNVRALLLTFAAAVTLSLLPGSASAQLRDTKALSLEGARRIMEAAEAEARRNNWNVSIAIVDAAGDMVLFQRMDAASPMSTDIAHGKARTSARFRRPTKALEDAVAGGRVALVTVEGATLMEGGEPIVVDGQVLGAVGVSGVTSAQDAQIARAGIAALRP